MGGRAMEKGAMRREFPELRLRGDLMAEGSTGIDLGES